jgi:hypothetical protein
MKLAATRVIAIFDDASLIRLVSMLAIDADGEWPVGRGSSDSPCRRCSNSERLGRWTNSPKYSAATLLQPPPVP